uniref:Uncharacterized protein n=1 Tax=Siphoviridae sp. ctHip2 TaxID=2827830 RepID=A0A8S5RW01_9CAUD|nr:MAG TPA: hypothetical protein [Siphoviridae sp. ctHip2]
MFLIAIILAFIYLASFHLFIVILYNFNFNYATIKSNEK